MQGPAKSKLTNKSRLDILSENLIEKKGRMLENGRLKQIKHSSDSNKRFKGRRECGVFRVKHTKNICSAINENNLPSRATTSSRESNSKETQFFPDV